MLVFACVGVLKHTHPIAGAFANFGSKPLPGTIRGPRASARGPWEAFVPYAHRTSGPASQQLPPKRRPLPSSPKLRLHVCTSPLVCSRGNVAIRGIEQRAEVRAVEIGDWWQCHMRRSALASPLPMWGPWIRPDTEADRSRPIWCVLFSYQNRNDTGPGAGGESQNGTHQATNSTQPPPTKKSARAHFRGS